MLYLFLLHWQYVQVYQRRLSFEAYYQQACFTLLSQFQCSRALLLLFQQFSVNSC
jgi:hypothetical protein